MTDPTFALVLEADDGTTRTVPLSFAIETLTKPDADKALARWDRETPSLLAASFLFQLTGLPEDEWPHVGPVLQGVIEGDTAPLEVVGHGV